jgi:hypothetical protein
MPFSDSLLFRLFKGRWGEREMSAPDNWRWTEEKLQDYVFELIKDSDTPLMPYGVSVTYLLEEIKYRTGGVVIDGHALNRDDILHVLKILEEVHLIKAKRHKHGRDDGALYRAVW